MLIYFVLQWAQCLEELWKERLQRKLEKARRGVACCSTWTCCSTRPISSALWRSSRRSSDHCWRHGPPAESSPSGVPKSIATEIVHDIWEQTNQNPDPIARNLNRGILKFGPKQYHSVYVVPKTFTQNSKFILAHIFLLLFF